MKICIVGNDYKQQFPLISYGGIESTVENLCKGLSEYTNSDIKFCAIVPKIINNRQKYNFKIIETNEIETSLSKKSAVFFAKEVKEIIQNSEFKPDIIWCQSHWSAIELESLNIPIICTIHCSSINQGQYTDKFIYNPKIYYRFVSKYMLENNFDTNCQRQKSIYNQSFFLHTGLDKSNFKLYEKKKNYILWVAGFNWNYQSKGLDDFIKLSEMNKDFDFLCYGTGDVSIENNLKEIDKKISNFHFSGELKRTKEHETVFGEAKFFAMFSKIPEAFGRTIIESISKGTPVLGYKTGAIPELIKENITGKIFNIGDLEGISKELYCSYDYKKCYEESKNFLIENEINYLIIKSRELLKL